MSTVIDFHPDFHNVVKNIAYWISLVHSPALFLEAIGVRWTKGHKCLIQCYRMINNVFITGGDLWLPVHHYTPTELVERVPTF